jgi:hypothetical protein
VLVADLHQQNADVAAEAMRNAGFDVTTATVDVSSRQSVSGLVDIARALGDITGVIHAAGVSPSQAPSAVILAVDLYGTAILLEEFGNVIGTGRCRCRDRVTVGSPPRRVDTRPRTPRSPRRPPTSCCRSRSSSPST